MGFTRQASSTTVNGVPFSSSSTVSSGGGGGGGIVGLVLIVGGVFMLWVVFRGKAPAMWDAITGNSGFDAKLNSFADAINPKSSGTGGGGGGGGSTGSKTTASANAPDSGTHMGIDSSGNIVTINSSYGNMTPDQKDAANAFAHQIGNVG